MADLHNDSHEDETSSSIGMKNGCFVMIITIIAVIILASCKPFPTILKPTGIPIKADGDLVKVLFPHAGSKEYAAQWFYMPGTGIINVEEYRIKITLEKINP
jgi:hypothetical protein